MTLGPLLVSVGLVGSFPEERMETTGWHVLCKEESRMQSEAGGAPAGVCSEVLTALQE